MLFVTSPSAGERWMGHGARQDTRAETCEAADPMDPTMPTRARGADSVMTRLAPTSFHLLGRETTSRRFSSSHCRAGAQRTLAIARFAATLTLRWSAEGTFPSRRITGTVTGGRLLTRSAALVVAFTLS